MLRYGNSESVITSKTLKKSNSTNTTYTVISNFYARFADRTVAREVRVPGNSRNFGFVCYINDTTFSLLNRLSLLIDVVFLLLL